MKKSGIFLFITISLFFSSCKYGLEELLFRDNSVSERANTIKYLESEGWETETENKEYEILVITDVHFGGENKGKNGGRFETEFYDWLESTYVVPGKALPLFMVSLGDIAEHGFSKEYRAYKFFTDNLESRYGIKTYNVVGNHDLYNEGWKNFENFNYPFTSFYKFRTSSFTFYFLDSASGSLGEKQLDSFENDMRYWERGRNKIVFTHVPAYAGNFFYFVMQNTVERNRFISACAKNDVQALVVGHTHDEITSNLGFTEYNIPGYLEKKAWALLKINEVTGQVSCRCFYLNQL